LNDACWKVGVLWCVRFAAIWTCMNVCMYVCMYVCVYVCMWICQHLGRYAFLNVFELVCMHVLTYVHKKKCTRERVRRKHFPSQRCNKAISTYMLRHLHLNTHTCIHTYIMIHTNIRKRKCKYAHIQSHMIHALKTTEIHKHIQTCMYTRLYVQHM